MGQGCASLLRRYLHESRLVRRGYVAQPFARVDPPRHATWPARRSRPVLLLAAPSAQPFRAFLWKGGAMFQRITAARERLRGQAQVTPILTSRTLNRWVGSAVSLKCENSQREAPSSFAGRSIWSWSRVAVAVYSVESPSLAKAWRRPVRWWGSSPRWRTMPP